MGRRDRSIIQGFALVDVDGIWLKDALAREIDRLSCSLPRSTNPRAKVVRGSEPGRYPGVNLHTASVHRPN